MARDAPLRPSPAPREPARRLPCSRAMSDRLSLAAGLMAGFAGSTGLDPEGPPRRYLWTDAFAVCNYLGLHRARGTPRDLELALRLVDQVHHTLGRHRPDDPR